jgi:hypothetical protein
MAMGKLRQKKNSLTPLEKLRLGSVSKWQEEIV